MLGGYVVLPKLQRLAERTLEDTLGTRGERDMPGSSSLLVLDDGLDLAEGGLIGHPIALQDLRGKTLLLADETEQEMLGTHICLFELAGLLLRVDEHLACLVSELLKHA